MSDNLSEAEHAALNRDIGQLEALIEELLTYARLDRPQTELKLTSPDLPATGFNSYMDDARTMNPQHQLLLTCTPAMIMARWICV